jgi:hypothetical protein
MTIFMGDFPSAIAAAAGSHCERSEAIQNGAQMDCFVTSFLCKAA